MENKTHEKKNFKKKPFNKKSNFKRNGHYSGNKFEKKPLEKSEKNFNRSNTKPQNVVENKFKINEEKAKTLLSFVILENCNTVQVLEDLSCYLAKTDFAIIYIHSSIKDLQQKIVENFTKNDITCNIYTNETEAQLHNKSFNENKSDIFIVANSNMSPRQYSLDVLVKYLYHDNIVATVPAVYNKLLEIQKYCCRFPSFVSKVKILFGNKTEKNRLEMIEYGIGSYYKAHRVDYSLSQIIVLNSKAFEKAAKFSTIEDSKISLITFYKNLNQCGNILFVPMARFIENNQKPVKKHFVSAFLYYLKNLI